MGIECHALESESVIQSISSTPFSCNPAVSKSIQRQKEIASTWLAGLAYNYVLQ